MTLDESTWGTPWLEALVDAVGFDPAVLARGGTAVQMGRVHEMEFEPGLVRAEVEGTSDVEIVTIGVGALEPDRWDQLVQTATESGLDAAALLAGELPIRLATMLLPAKGHVSCDCTCKDGDDLCRHGAAVCHRIAERLAVDPFALLLLRGRDRAVVLSALRSSRAQALGVEQPAFSGLPRGVDKGVSAADAWRVDPDPPVVAPSASRRSGKLPTLAVPPPAGSGIEEAALAELVADGAARAQAMLAGTGNSGLGLSVGADVVRRAAGGDIEQVSKVTGVPLHELTGAARAWQVGGEAGFKISRHNWEPEVGALAPAQAVLGPAAKVRANLVSFGPIQLRLDEDGFWWRFVADDALGWVLDSSASSDPIDLVVGNTDLI